MTGEFLRFQISPAGVLEGKNLMRFQSEISVFKFLRGCVGGNQVSQVAQPAAHKNPANQDNLMKLQEKQILFYVPL